MSNDIQCYADAVPMLLIERYRMWRTHAPAVALRSLRWRDPLGRTTRRPWHPGTVASWWLTKRRVLFLVLVVWAGKCSRGRSAVDVDRWTGTRRRMTGGVSHRSSYWPRYYVVWRGLRYKLGCKTRGRVSIRNLRTLRCTWLRN